MPCDCPFCASHRGCVRIRVNSIASVWGWMVSERGDASRVAIRVGKEERACDSLAEAAQLASQLCHVPSIDVQRVVSGIRVVGDDGAERPVRDSSSPSASHPPPRGGGGPFCGLLRAQEEGDEEGKRREEEGEGRQEEGERREGRQEEGKRREGRQKDPKDDARGGRTNHQPGSRKQPSRGKKGGAAPPPPPSSAPRASTPPLGRGARSQPYHPRRMGGDATAVAEVLDARPTAEEWDAEAVEALLSAGARPPLKSVAGVREKGSYKCALCVFTHPSGADTPPVPLPLSVLFAMYRAQRELFDL